MSDKKSSRLLGSICVLLECVGDPIDRFCFNSWEILSIALAQKNIFTKPEILPPRRDSLIFSKSQIPANFIKVLVKIL